MCANGKMRPAEIIPGMGGEGNKGEWWRGWIQVWYIWYVARTFINATIYSMKHNNKNKKINK
jgi:hypothetical protein